MTMTMPRLRRIFLGLGAALALFAAARWWHGERSFARMQPTTCTLVIKTIEPQLLVKQYRRSGRNAKLRYREDGRLLFSHTHRSRKYMFREDFNSDELRLEDYEEGKAYPCRYDPDEPARATITTAFDREEVDTELVLAGFLVFIGVMMPQIWRQAAEGFAQMKGR